MIHYRQLIVCESLQIIGKNHHKNDRLLYIFSRPNDEVYALRQSQSKSSEMGGGREKEPNGRTAESPDKNLVKSKNGKSELSEENTTVTPPDGGWGWMVVLASFVIHVIADGIVYSFGIFYIEFLHYYKGGKGETAWVGSLVPGVTLSVGEYGVRTH